MTASNECGLLKTKGDGVFGFFTVTDGLNICLRDVRYLGI